METTKRIVRMVSIAPEVREKLTEYANENPHIKIMYFVGDAILEKIERENQRKQLTAIIGAHPSFRKAKDENGTKGLTNAKSGTGGY